MMVPKKVDKQLKTLIASRWDFQSAIELLKQYNDILSKLYSDLYNAVIHKKEKTWRNKRFRYHYHYKRNFGHAVRNVKRSKEIQHDSKKTGNMAPLHKKLRSPMEKPFSNRYLFCLRMSEEQSHTSRSKVLFDREKIATETFVVFFYNIDEM